MEDTAGCLALSLAYTQFSYTVHNYLPMATPARSSRPSYIGQSRRYIHRQSDGGNSSIEASLSLTLGCVMTVKADN